MTDVVFLHGTGVREPRYGLLLDRIRSGLASAAAGTRVHPCYWAEADQAWLRSGGISVPSGISPRADPELTQGTQDDEDRAWDMLTLSPTAELVALTGSGLPTELSPAQAAADATAFPAERIREDTTTAAMMRSAGMSDAFAAAIQRLSGDATVIQACALHELDEIRWPLARAVVAETLLLAEADWGDDWAITGQHRDGLVGAVAQAVTLGARGMGGATARFAFNLALHSGVTRPIERHRAGLSRSASLLAGDVLHYLVRGENVDAYVRRTLDRIPEPVVLLGHSLGGVIAAEVLARARLANVIALVTVGSQTGYLYELDCLHWLRHGQGLPEHFPRPWINIYDPRDLLSFLVSPLFPGRAGDLAFDNGRAFPRCHSAYFDNKTLYSTLGALLRDLSA